MATMTCPTEGSQLAAFLQHAYQNAQGELPLSTSAELSIWIDDFERSDVRSHFCSMSVLIENTAAARFTLYLKNPPLDDDVTELIRAKNGRITGSLPNLQVEISLLTKQVSFLRELARAFRRIVGRGRTYSNRNWKWVCRRTAASIDQLANRLMEYRNLKRHRPWCLATAPSRVAVSKPPASGLSSNRSRVDNASGPSQADSEDLFCLLDMK